MRAVQLTLSIGDDAPVWVSLPGVDREDHSRWISIGKGHVVVFLVTIVPTPLMLKTV